MNGVGTISIGDFEKALLAVGIVGLVTESPVCRALFLGCAAEYRRARKEADEADQNFFSGVNVVVVDGKSGQQTEAHDHQTEQHGGVFAGVREVLGERLNDIADSLVRIKRQGFELAGCGGFFEVSRGGSVVAVRSGWLNRLRFGVFGHGVTYVKSAQSTGAAS